MAASKVETAQYIRLCCHFACMSTCKGADSHPFPSPLALQRTTVRARKKQSCFVGAQAVVRTQQAPGRSRAGVVSLILRRDQQTTKRTSSGSSDRIGFRILSALLFSQSCPQGSVDLHIPWVRRTGQPLVHEFRRLGNCRCGTHRTRAHGCGRHPEIQLPMKSSVPTSPGSNLRRYHGAHGNQVKQQVGRGRGAERAKS